jgi:hypothetical protein
MSYNEKLRDLYQQYERTSHAQPFTMHELAALGLRSGLVHTPTIDHRKPACRRILPRDERGFFR